MSAYSLPTIPKFEKRHKTIVQAAKSRDWSILIGEFDKQPISDRASILIKTSDLIFVEGLLVVRFPDEAAENCRDAFKGWLTTTSDSLLDETGQVSVKRGIKQSESVESLFRDAYKRCCHLATGHDPVSLVWASIRLAYQWYVKLRSQALSICKVARAGSLFLAPTVPPTLAQNAST